MILRGFVRFHRILRFASLLAAVAVFQASVVAATTTEEVFPQLQDVLRDALRQSPAMIQRNLSRLAAEQSILMSSAALYPRVSASMTYQAAKENQSQDAPDRGWIGNTRNNYSISASHPLLHWGENGAAADIGKIAAKIASNDVRDGYRDLARQIRSAYLQLIIDQASLRVGEFAEELARRRITVLQTRVDSGELLAGSTGGAEQELNETLLAAERSAAAFERSLRGFRRLIGNPNFSAEALPDGIPEISPLTPEEIAQKKESLATGLETDGRRVNKSFEVRQQELSLQIAKVAQRPKLDLSTGLSQDQLTYVSNLGNRTGVQSLYVGVSASWNIFDGRATRGRIRVARTRLQQLEIQLADLTEELRYAAEQSSLQLDFTRRALKLSELRYAGALASFDLTKDHFDRKRISQDDLDNARYGLNSAEVGLFAVRAAYLNAVAEWLYSFNADPAVPATILSSPAR